MSETKHTPGPWVASQPTMGFSDIRQESTGKLIFALAHPSTKQGDGEISDEEKYANLALLAAAPDMYEALHMLWAMFDDGRIVRNISHDGKPDWALRMLEFTKELQFVQLVIAKAECGS